MSEIGGFGHLSGGPANQLFRVGTSQVKLERRIRPVVERDLVKYTIFLKMRQRQHQAARVGADEDGIGARQHIDDRQGFPLEARHEGLATPARRQPLDLVGREIVQELGPIPAPDFESHPFRPVSPGNAVLCGMIAR